MKKVLFLAPNRTYANTVVKNTCEKLEKKGVSYGASEGTTSMAIQTDNIRIDLVWLDPVKWTSNLFHGRDAVFGKKELVEQAKEKVFFLGTQFPTVSLIRYILECEENPEPEDKPRENYIPFIKNVYFNDPMTIVIWEDGTKTMVKCQEGDVYSEEVGLAICIAKKSLGNQGNFNNVFKKWVPETKPGKVGVNITPAIAAETVNDYMDKLREEILAKTRRLFK